LPYSQYHRGGLFTTNFSSGDDNFYPQAYAGMIALQQKQLVYLQNDALAHLSLLVCFLLNLSTLIDRSL